MTTDKIVCGDCLDVMKDIPDNSVDLVLTDPPFASGGRDGSVHLNDPTMRGNRMQRDSHIWFMRHCAAQYFRLAKPDSHTYVFTDWRKHKDLITAFETVGWECRSLIVWNKGNGMGEFWRSSHEFILFFTKQKPRKLTHGGCFNVLDFAPVRGKAKYHPAQKPIALLSFLIEASTIKKEIVLDSFLGCGPTISACLDLGRHYIGIDISPEYCEIARKRVEAAEKGITVKELEQGQKVLF